MKRIGIVALQGGFAAHESPLAALGHRPFFVKGPRDLEHADGLVLPGGESSVHLKMMARFGLESALSLYARTGKPILATCAGIILAARRVVSPEQRSFDFLDIDVTRNAFGRQCDSFEAMADDGVLPLVFIRAPRITRVGAARVFATWRGEPVLVRQGNVIGATFHPELTPDRTTAELAFGRG